MGLGMLSALGVVGPLLVLLSVTIPVFCTFFFCTDGAMQSPCTFFFHWPIILRSVQNHSMGDGSYPGWIFCFLHLNNCGCFSRENWPICPGLEQVCVGCHGIRPWGVLSDLEGCDNGCSFRLLPLLGCVSAGGRRIFFHLGPSCGVGDSLKFSLHQIIYSHLNRYGC